MSVIVIHIIIINFHQINPHPYKPNLYEYVFQTSNEQRFDTFTQIVLVNSLGEKNSCSTEHRTN